MGLSGYSSPLDYPRSGNASSGKRSASPNRGGVVSGSGVAGVYLLLQNPNGVFTSRNHIPVFPSPAVVCPSTGRRGSLGGGGTAGGISDSLPVCFSSVLGTHPHALVFPDIHQGESSGGDDPFACSEGHSGACSSSFSGLLQPVICSVEDLRVVEVCDRPL